MCRRRAPASHTGRPKAPHVRCASRKEGVRNGTDGHLRTEDRHDTDIAGELKVAARGHHEIDIEADGAAIGLGVGVGVVIARAAEDTGFDSVWVGDHLLYRDDGKPTRAPWEA